MTTFNLRVHEKIEDGPLVKLSCVDHDLHIWSSTAVGGTGEGGPEGMGGLNVTRLEILDIPLLRTEDDTPGIYLAARGTAGSWPGAVIYRSSDGGLTYQQTITMSKEAILGITETVLPDWQGGNVVDVCSTVVVSIIGGTLSTITHLQLLNGGNACVIGNELIRFRKAELLSAGQYRLSGLLRGRRGTEQHMGTHLIGERFVLLEESKIYRMPEDIANIGRTLRYRAVTNGDQSTQGFVSTLSPLRMVSMLPLSPVYVNAVRITGDGYAVKWIRRTRYPAPWADGSDAPIGEGSERYSVRSRAGSGLGVIELASEEVTTNTDTLGTSASDFGGTTIDVAQISERVGRGFSGTFALPLPS